MRNRFEIYEYSHTNVDTISTEDRIINLAITDGVLAKESFTAKEMADIVNGANKVMVSYPLFVRDPIIVRFREIERVIEYFHGIERGIHLYCRGHQLNEKTIEMYLVLEVYEKLSRLAAYYHLINKYSLSYINEVIQNYNML